jgi:hypothetical protein
LIFKAINENRLHCIRIREMMIRNATGELKFEWDPVAGEFKKQNFHLFNMVQRYKGYSIESKKKGENIWRLRYNELDGVPIEEYPPDAASYAIEDSVETLDIWDAQNEKELQGDEIPGLVSQMQAAWALYLTGTWGFRTEPEAVREFKKSLQRDFAEEIAVCQEYGFRRSGKETSRDMKAIKAAVERCYADMGKPVPLTEKGDVSTDRDALMATDHPGLHAVSESIKLEKQLTTYAAALERGTEVPLNPNYNALIETFRTSCSGGMKIDKIPVGMNVQNLPRKGGARACVVPREGWVFAFCDLDTIEMRSLGQVCIDWYGKSQIVEAIKAGVDTHVYFASQMIDMPYRDAITLHESGDKKIGDERQFCKIANYGFMGGMGPDTFVDYAKAQKITVSKDKARQLHSGFRHAWPEVSQYLADIGYLCRGGSIDVVFPRSGMVRGRVRYTAACNGNFQHLAAMGAKASLYQVVYECYCDSGSPLYGCRPWLFCHDEVGIEIPEYAFSPQEVHAAAMRLQRIMIEETAKWHPNVPIGASVALARRWHKGAKAIYEKGLIVPAKPVEQGGKTIWVRD